MATHAVLFVLLLMVPGGTAGAAGQSAEVTEYHGTSALRPLAGSVGYEPQEWTTADSPPPAVQLAAWETESPLPPLRPTPQLPASEPFLSLNDGEFSDADPTATPSRQGDHELLVQTGTWTVVVLCLCVLTILGVRRFQRARGIVPQQRGTGRVLETMSLGSGRSVSLIQMHGLRALVGCDAGGIRTIALAGPDFAEELNTVMDDADGRKPEHAPAHSPSRGNK